MSTPTPKEVNTIITDNGALQAIAVFVIAILVFYFVGKILMERQKIKQEQKMKDEDRAFERKQREEDRKEQRKRDEREEKTREENTKALQDLIKEVTKAVENSNSSVLALGDKLTIHESNANCNFKEVNETIKDLKDMLNIAINVQDDLAKKEMIEELDKKIDKLFDELKK
ncbi:hypothetical protein HV819_02310 [Anaerococcus sp. AGMB00486]|uniref:Uncharacterized protein n=1 Tax=Anaerococcus faecalis TaxID=2742993 RepID=A0ABX2N835_9FIRM|nr:hypothetical protein [Anaerococcus faecalis]NVF10830.1 hypothetical protein [Anaerococcus faecalis]